MQPISGGIATGFTRRADLRPRKIVKEGRARPSESNAKLRNGGRALLSFCHEGHADKFSVVAAISPWAAHVDRLGFHGELHFFPRFLGQFHQHRQPLAGRRARRLKAHLNNNSSVFRTIHTYRLDSHVSIGMHSFSEFRRSQLYERIIKKFHKDAAFALSWLRCFIVLFFFSGNSILPGKLHAFSFSKRNPKMKVQERNNVNTWEIHCLFH